jgi:4-amino-4-deoxy-L-arabinose transferase-like glycosyltransferase
VKGFFTRLVATSERRVALALAAFFALVVLPFASSYGLWDPWETHYGEVARQMVARNDWVSLWWPGSSMDHPPRGEFWSKPVLTFWLEALSLKLFFLEGAHARPDELVTSFRVEWALRLPSILLSFAAIFAVWELVKRIAGKRAGAIAGVVLLTSPQWLLITRQAMTDMPFVAPMTIALALAGLALLAPDDNELPRRRWRMLSWPHAPAFYGFLSLFVLTTLPQLLVDSIQVRFYMGSSRILWPGVVAMAPWIVVFLVGLWWSARAKTRRQLYLLSAWVLCALASLAKGPAGLAMPAIVLVLYLVAAGRWKEIFLRLELPRGALLFIATGFPWWHAMFIRHGMPWWNELIGDNYVNRAMGRSGDRGTFPYYFEVLEWGLFPWSGLAAVGALAAFLRGKDARAALKRFCLVWALVDFVVISVVNTKFHHYVLPALPPLAILAALFIDDVLRAPRRWHAFAIAAWGLPVTLMAGRDLAIYPPRLLWLFDYDYVLVPGVGRPWPIPATYGNRYEYGGTLALFTVAATIAMALLAWFAARGKAADADELPAPTEPGHPYRSPADQPDAPAPSPAAPKHALVVAALVLLALIVGIAAGPSTTGPAPLFSPSLWLLPALLMLGALVLLSRTLPRAPAIWVLAAVATVSSAFMIDRYLPDLGPHWSQKHVIAAYYANRDDASEPMIVWDLYWRGENLYTRNEVFNQATPNDRWAWTQPRDIATQYFARYKGRIFFLVERVKLESLKGNLPQAAREKVKIVDESNNKLLLVETRL